MAVSPPICDFGASWHDFAFPEPGGAIRDLASVAGPRGLLVMFICNHCPYVQAILPRIVRDAHEIMDHGIGVAAICSNDAERYLEDGPDRMLTLARDLGFRFPYLHDAQQTAARTYGAECTPDFFGYNADGALQYRGRLDASGRKPAPDDAPRELFDAMLLIARTGQGPREQIPSMGCSIKWRS